MYDHPSIFSSLVGFVNSLPSADENWPFVERNHFENGRRYPVFEDGWYFMPNDEHEQDRLDFVHHIFKLVLNNFLNRSLNYAPLENPRHALDLGTGTGVSRFPPPTVFRRTDLPIGLGH